MSAFAAEPALSSETEPYNICCAETWGGVSAKQDEVATPGIRAAIHSSASGAEKGGDLYYFSVCAFDTLTRIAIADVRGHGLAASQLSEWLYESIERRMNDTDGSRILEDLNGIVGTRGFSATTTAVVATFHRDKGLFYYGYAGHPPMMLARPGQPWRELAAPAGSVRRICRSECCRMRNSSRTRRGLRRVTGFFFIPTASRVSGSRRRRRARIVRRQEAIRHSRPLCGGFAWRVAAENSRRLG